MNQSRAWTWRQAIADSELPGDSRFILLTLSLFMNDMGGSCFPSIETLVQKTGKSKRTIIKYLDIAKKAGWIAVDQVKVSRKDGDNRGWKRNEYTASWPDEDMQSEAVETSHSDENTIDSHAEKGGAPHALPSEKGGASDAEGGAPDANKVVRHTHPNTPENLSTISQQAQAREKEDLKGDSGKEDLNGDSKKQITDQFHALVKLYPSSVGDSWVKPEKDWKLLTDDQRHAALERCDDYVAAVKAQPGRSYLVAVGKYINERMWERLGEIQAKPDLPHLAKKYGKEWFAYRMWLLDQPRKQYRPTASAAAAIRSGKGAAYDNSRWLAEYPEIHYMDEAARLNRDVGVPRDVPLLNFDDFEKVMVGSEAYNAWGLWHLDKDTPWIDPPKYIKWIWMPSEFPPATTTAADDETQEFLRATQ